MLELCWKVRECMFVKIENWDDGTPLILNTDNIKAIHHYIGESTILKDYYTVDFSNTCFYHITEQQYQELCEILTKRL